MGASFGKNINNIFNGVGQRSFRSIYGTSFLTAILSFIVFKTTSTDMSQAKAKRRAKKAAKKVNA